jgi:hypothetical protein
MNIINIFMLDLTNLETKGYCVIKNFLTLENIEKLKDDYFTQLKSFKEKKPNLNYDVIYSKYSLQETILPILNDITITTNIEVNHIVGGGLYLDTQMINFDWHQDHESYYRWQDLYNSVNFWMPIIKPIINKSGLSIIPQDKLLEHCPEIFKSRIKGKGAKKFKFVGSKTVMIDDDIGGLSLLDFDINQLAVSPELNPGDLCLLRQDVIHRTQDSLPDRVALSIRAINRNTILYKEKLVTGCAHKQKMIERNPLPYKKILQYFENNNITECSIAEILSLT